MGPSPNVESLLEVHTDSSATITEGQREENAEDINAYPQITNDPAARRQRIMEWEERGRFPSKEEWQQSLRNEGQFVTHFSKNTTRGVVKILRCAYGKKVGWHKCPYKLRVEHLPGGEVVECWNGEEHHHQQVMALQVPALRDEQVQHTIKEAVLDGLKPERIIMKLERLGLPVPSRRSLYNRVAYLRRTVTKDSSEFSTKDLRDWAETLSCTLEEDAPLVIGQNVDDNTGEDGIPNFQVTVSTRRLVKLLEKSDCWPLHVDGTYKLTWQGFPVLISGITDAQHRFHPVSLSLVSHERTSAYKHLFTALKEAHADESGRELEPLFVIADGSAAITATVKTVFPRCPRGMCWAHVVRNVDKKLLGVRNEERRKRFRWDLHLL